MITDLIDFKYINKNINLCVIGGGDAGIRTLGARRGTPDFESGPFDNSGTSSNDAGCPEHQNSAASLKPQIFFDFVVQVYRLKFRCPRPLTTYSHPTTNADDLECPQCEQEFARLQAIGHHPTHRIVRGKVQTKGMRRK